MTQTLRIPVDCLRWLRPLARAAKTRGLALFAVGGCVRDWRLKRPCRDLDLVTEGDPKPLAAVAGKLLGVRPESFGQFGTLRVAGFGFRIDLAASRKERYDQPASLPQVSPAPLRLDLFRRDFTVNSMAVRLTGGSVGEIIDPCGGMADLKARVLRVHHAQSFSDDPTRVFRAARYQTRYRLSPAPGVIAAVRAALKAGHPDRLSRHRIAQELIRILEEPDPGKPLALLKQWGYLALIHPRLRWPRKFPSDWREALAGMALKMGTDGEELLRGLPIARDVSSWIFIALRTAVSGASPRGVLPAAAKSSLRRAFPKLPKGALDPVFLKGVDLSRAGVPPGKSYGRIIDEAARRQWTGKDRSRSSALGWLKKKAPSSSGR